MEVAGARSRQNTLSCFLPLLCTLSSSPVWSQGTLLSGLKAYWCEKLRQTTIYSLSLALVKMDSERLQQQQIRVIWHVTWNADVTYYMKWRCYNVIVVCIQSLILLSWFHFSLHFLYSWHIPIQEQELFQPFPTNPDSVIHLCIGSK